MAGLTMSPQLMIFKWQLNLPLNPRVIFLLVGITECMQCDATCTSKKILLVSFIHLQRHKTYPRHLSKGSQTGSQPAGQARRSSAPSPSLWQTQSLLKEVVVQIDSISLSYSLTHHNLLHHQEIQDWEKFSTSSFSLLYQFILWLWVGIKLTYTVYVLMYMYRDVHVFWPWPVQGQLLWGSSSSHGQSQHWVNVWTSSSPTYRITHLVTSLAGRDSLLWLRVHLVTKNHHNNCGCHWGEARGRSMSTTLTTSRRIALSLSLWSALTW